MFAIRTVLAPLALALATLPAACGTGHSADYAPGADDRPAPVASKPSPVERGAYLVATSGCHDCHTPMIMTPKGPGPDLTRALSGHPADMLLPPPPAPVGPWIVASAATATAHAGPWGISYSANLTPDEETGLGTWTAQSFIDTIRNGRHLGAGRPLNPPMPWPVYKNMTDEDLTAIFAYLQTIPAVKNRVPDPQPPATAADAAAAPAGKLAAR
jgi:mono/diheme cytochrome c family protein